jgi:hypothetical protein
VTDWSRWSLVFFAYLAIVAEIRSGVARRTRIRVWCAAALGAGLTVAARRLPPEGLMDVWILPPVILLIGYWTSGLLFVRPMPRAESALAAIDRLLRIDALAARTPRWLAELLEFAYSGIYVTILVSLVLALRSGADAGRFWTVILLTDYVCFGMLPWFQTRPPRAVGFETPWRSTWRRLNLRLLAAGSVQVNTFPSGHAAEALAAALLVSAAPVPFVAAMFVIALAISAGAVFGRYHYAADAIAGWAVAVAVYCFYPQ